MKVVQKYLGDGNHCYRVHGEYGRHLSLGSITVRPMWKQIFKKCPPVYPEYLVRGVPPGRAKKGFFNVLHFTTETYLLCYTVRELGWWYMEPDPYILKIYQCKMMRTNLSFLPVKMLKKR